MRNPPVNQNGFPRAKIGAPGRIGRRSGLSRAGPRADTNHCHLHDNAAIHTSQNRRNQNYQMGYIDPKLVEGATALVESFTCAICFNLFEKPRTACSKGHTFCADCLTAARFNPVILFYR